jgi:hypothetical protein
MLEPCHVSIARSMTGGGRTPSRCLPQGKSTLPPPQLERFIWKAGSPSGRLLLCYKESAEWRMGFQFMGFVLHEDIVESEIQRSSVRKGYQRIHPRVLISD